MRAAFIGVLLGALFGAVVGTFGTALAVAIIAAIQWNGLVGFFLAMGTFGAFFGAAMAADFRNN